MDIACLAVAAGLWLLTAGLAWGCARVQPRKAEGAPVSASARPPEGAAPSLPEGPAKRRVSQ